MVKPKMQRIRPSVSQHQATEPAHSIITYFQIWTNEEDYKTLGYQFNQKPKQLLLTQVHNRACGRAKSA